MEKAVTGRPPDPSTMAWGSGPCVEGGREIEERDVKGEESGENVPGALANRGCEDMARE